MIWNQRISQKNAIRWIDTSCMVVDCLTKKMSPAILLKLIAESRLSLGPTIEPQLLKLKKQKLRREKKTGIKETGIKGSDIKGNGISGYKVSNGYKEYQNEGQETCTLSTG